MRILNDEWYALRASENDYHFPFHRVDPRAAQPDEALYRELLDGMMQDALIDLLSEMPMDRIPTLPDRSAVERHAVGMVDSSVERLRSSLLKDVFDGIADPRVFAMGVMSPELHDYCSSMYRTYREQDDAVFGRWVWHVMEDVPLLGPDAVKLSRKTKASSFAMEEFDDGYVLTNFSTRITLHDASILEGSFHEHISCRFSEIYREGGVWEIHTTGGEGSNLTFRAGSFDIEVVSR